MNRLDHIKELIKNGDRDPFLLFAEAKETEKIDFIASIDLYENLRSSNPEYVGLYLHLGKCYEKKGDFTSAKLIYTTGIDSAKKVGDFHSASELNSALNMLEEEEN